MERAHSTGSARDSAEGQRSDASTSSCGRCARTKKLISCQTFEKNYSGDGGDDAGSARGGASSSSAAVDARAEEEEEEEAAAAPKRARTKW